MPRMRVGRFASYISWFAIEIVRLPIFPRTLDPLRASLGVDTAGPTARVALSSHEAVGDACSEHGF